MPTIIPIPAFADNYIWLLREGRAAAVVDAGDAAPVIDYLDREQVELTAIICTHHHGDHVGGNRALQIRLDVFNTFNQAAVTNRNASMTLSSPADPNTILNLPYNADGSVRSAFALPRGAGFGVATAYQAPRTMQFQIRFSF